MHDVQIQTDPGMNDFLKEQSQSSFALTDSFVWDIWTPFDFGCSFHQKLTGEPIDPHEWKTMSSMAVCKICGEEEVPIAALTKDPYAVTFLSMPKVRIACAELPKASTTK